MTSLLTVSIEEFQQFVSKLAEAGFTAETARAVIANPEFAKMILDAARRRNPFEMTVPEQIKALTTANREMGWGISNETIIRLAETAPAWPNGFDSYRSFRIRFGEGCEGVAQTFEAHALRIQGVHKDLEFCRWEFLRSDNNHLRLLSGNTTHKPTIDWIIVHLDANRVRKSGVPIRDSNLLADEGLVMAWLFPERLRATDRVQWTIWYCAGYEVNIPEIHCSWNNAPYVSIRPGKDIVDLACCYSHYNDQFVSFPTFEQ